jgi:uncharacterized membrane protein YgcG
MEMTPARIMLCAVGFAAALAGCAKPSEEACDRAVVNIRKVSGQSQAETREAGTERRAAVRACRAQSDRDTVECYAEAQTREELLACGGEMAEMLLKKGEAGGAGSGGAGSGSGSGSGTGSGSGSGS